MNDDFDALTVARLFQEIPWNEFVLAVAIVVPLCEARGDFASEQLRPLLAALTGGPSDTRTLVDAAGRLLTMPDLRDDEIERLYEQLQVLADSGQPDEAKYQETLARLRTLQEAEAGEMTAFADRRRQLAEGAVEADFARITRLLEAHEGPPA